jgi:hypothetical protein
MVPLALEKRGHELDAAILGCQPTRLSQPRGCLFPLTPQERDQAAIGPAGRLPRDELGDALKRRRSQSGLAHLRRSHTSVEGRNGLRERRRGWVG